MQETIEVLIISRKSNPTEEWKLKIPHVARRLEDQFYQEATSLQEYRDKSTLRARIKNVFTFFERNYNNGSSNKNSSQRQHAKSSENITIDLTNSEESEGFETIITNSPDAPRQAVIATNLLEPSPPPAPFLAKMKFLPHQQTTSL
jgi:AAA15 family ATPase/GTPase